jgi:hypothetical protein
MVRFAFIPEHEACYVTQRGMTRLTDLQPEDLLHDSTTLRDSYGYSDSEADVGNRIVDNGFGD